MREDQQYQGDESDESGWLGSSVSKSAADGLASSKVAQEGELPVVFLEVWDVAGEFQTGESGLLGLDREAVGAVGSARCQDG